jgi:hypothetical protein
VGGSELKIKLNSAQLELELGLSLAIKSIAMATPRYARFTPPVEQTFHVSSSTDLSFEARDKFSKRKLLPRTQSYLLANWISSRRARARVEPRFLF